ncbi:MAG: ribbon-helix-helix domain-containing protein [Rhizobiaceae bacterium]|nr:ribbon-helix-helix domain-containing protein [Rhizobiaceae bacterium]
MSGIVKRSVAIRGHRTSISLEDAFFDELSRIAAGRELALAALIAEIDATRDRRTNLSSALRLFVLDDLKARNGPHV